MDQAAKYVIVGAGPGGLQMAYFLQQAGRDYVVLERSDHPGSFFDEYPRHRTLISINKRHNFFDEDEFNWRHDWNSLLSDDPELRFTRYSDELFPSAEDLRDYLRDFAEKLALNIKYGVEVLKIDRAKEGGFGLVSRDHGSFGCSVLLLGLGAVAPRSPANIEGIELADGYESHSLDLDRYKNKRVAIVGQGNSAFEVAEHLGGVASFVHILAKQPIRFAWDTHFVGDVRAVNNNIFDMYQLKSLHAVLNPRLLRIDRTQSGTLQTTHEYDYPKSSVPGTLHLTREYDFIIRCCGWDYVPSNLFAPEVRPVTVHGGKFPSLTPSWESENVENMFFIGTAMQGNDRKSASGFIHGFRYNIRTLAALLEERYEAQPYPRQRIPKFSWDTFADYLYERVSVSAALFQLFGTLCDVVIVDQSAESAEIHRELPVDEVNSRNYGDRHVFVLTLDFGFHMYSESALTFLGPSDPSNPRCAAFLHPVLRYRGPSGVHEFHFGDSLLARWDRPHSSGGAVTSYDRDLFRWFHTVLGQPFDEVVADTTESPFRPWSDEEMLAWRALQTPTEEASNCHNALATDPLGRPGARGHVPE